MSRLAVWESGRDPAVLIFVCLFAAFLLAKMRQLFTMLTWGGPSRDAAYEAYVSTNGIDGASDFPRFLRKLLSFLPCGFLSG
jgi:hypothetical protein